MSKRVSNVTIYSDDESSDDDDIVHSANRLTTRIKVGNKRIRLHLCIESEFDSEEELDELLAESILDKVGLKLRKMWVHPLNMLRASDGEFARLYPVHRKYPEKFYSYYRMSVTTFDYILHAIENDIAKNSRRPSIKPEERLAVTLRYLATGMSFVSIGESFLMDNYTVGIIVKEVCRAIYNNLVNRHMPVPSPERLKLIAEEFEERWNFPNVVGTLDGKHIRIKCPPKSGTMFHNYKNFFSIVLQAVADSNYKFIFIDVGAYGKQSDGGTFEASSLSSFVCNPKNFPPERSIIGLKIKLPYLFLVDDAYPLRRNMMKPYSHNNLTRDEMIFNGRLSRARRCVECSFGLMANKWRILLKAIETKVSTACDIVKCITVLHNVIIDMEGKDDGLMERVREKIEMSNKFARLSVGRKYNHSSHDATVVRKCLTEYFNGSYGSVTWQDRYAAKDAFTFTRAQTS